MTIKELQRAIHSNAINKGWYDSDRSALEYHALFHSEIAEATECVRKNQEYLYFNGLKPEGEAVELADCVIRIMDYFEFREWDLSNIISLKMDYNKTREYRHGGKLY